MATSRWGVGEQTSSGMVARLPAAFSPSGMNSAETSWWPSGCVPMSAKELPQPSTGEHIADLPGWVQHTRPLIPAGCTWASSRTGSHVLGEGGVADSSSRVEAKLAIGAETLGWLCASPGYDTVSVCQPGARALACSVACTVLESTGSSGGAPTTCPFSRYCTAPVGSAQFGLSPSLLTP